MKSSIEIVDAQLQAYNARDIDAFMACYTEDVKTWRVGGELLASGQAAMRAQYEQLFRDHPASRAYLVSRMSAATTVIDHELVLGRADGIVQVAFAIFEVRDGLISQVWFRTEATYPAKE